MRALERVTAKRMQVKKDFEKNRKKFLTNR